MERAEKISEFLAERITAGDFPSAVYLVGEKGKIVFSDATGKAVAEPEEIPAQPDTIYDLASLTKPLVTGLLCAKILETRQIRLSDAVSRYLPGFSEKKTTLQQLLTHKSGFAAWKPFYLLTGDNADLSRGEKMEKVLEIIAGEPLGYQPEEKTLYSDLNFLTLGAVVEKIYGQNLDVIAEREIFRPLKLERTFFNPPADLKRETAASERGNNYEKKTCIDNGYDVNGYTWRENIIWGEVHDGNAYFLDGAAGHAGLFSTAEETFQIAQQFLPGTSKLLDVETCNMFHGNYTPGLNEARSVAFELAATEGSTAGDALAKDSFGHLGFTGTSLWTEPRSERVFILLTNRTHARDLPFININSVRREFHKLAMEELDR